MLVAYAVSKLIVYLIKSVNSKLNNHLISKLISLGPFEGAEPKDSVSFNSEI
jgi:hypothetical protein